MSDAQSFTHRVDADGELTGIQRLATGQIVPTDVLDNNDGGDDVFDNNDVFGAGDVGLGLDGNSDWLVGLESVYDDVPLSGPAALHCFLDPRIAPGYLAWVVQDGEES